jgi:4-hydroxy-3-methylbut-2-en-1-yl diphosphate reductase
MGIVYADTMGFCAGVRRAVSILEEQLAEDDGSKLSTCGPLIHNPRLIADFESRGVRVAGSAAEVERGERIVIRAHGISRKLRRELEERGAKLIDATCPKVILSMRKAQRAEEEGMQVLLVGDAGHGEMEAVAGSLEKPEAAMVIGTVGEAGTVELQEKVCLIAQTTFDDDEYGRIAEVIRRRAADCRIEYSICPATRGRQEALRSLAKKVDGIIIIGGRNSANTQRLYEIAAASGVPAWQVEGPDEVPPEVGGIRTVGISAGASTPDETVRRTAEMVEKLQRESL